LRGPPNTEFSVDSMKPLLWPGTELAKPPARGVAAWRAAWGLTWPARSVSAAVCSMGLRTAAGAPICGMAASSLSAQGSRSSCPSLPAFSRVWRTISRA
jgi:hypothetical protein